MNDQNLILCAFIAVGLVGCGGGNSGGIGSGMEPQEAVVKELGDLLRCGTGKPTQIADLQPFESNFPASFNAVKSGALVVFWGNSMLGEGDSLKSEGKLIAFDKETETLGGWVLMTNGTVKKVSATEFVALKTQAKKGL